MIFSASLQFKETRQHERMNTKLSCSFTDEGQSMPKLMVRPTVHLAGRGGSRE